MNEDAKYHKCTDTRGRAIRGLWTRRGLYYAQLQLPGKGCRRVPLLDEEKRHVTTVPKAVIARAALLAGISRGNLPGPMITPLFKDYAGKYIDFLESTSAKSPLTVKKERCSLNNWRKFFGDLRLNQITRAHLNDYAVDRSKTVSPRSVNLDVIALRHLLNHAKSEGLLKYGLPTDDWVDLKYVAPKRTLLPDDAVERLCAAALAKTEDGKPKYENGVFLSDYIKFLAYSGARRMAGLTAKWADVDFANRQITLHTKFDRVVFVDLNDKLERHLNSMFGRRVEGGEYLFPSPRPGETGAFFTNPHKVFNSVRIDAGLPDMTLHDLRHAFASACIRDGVDVLVVANWLGHQDGGKLLLNTYAHLNSKHRKDSANKVQFTPALMAQPASATLDNHSVADLMAALQRKLADPSKKAA